MRHRGHNLELIVYRVRKIPTFGSVLEISYITTTRFPELLDLRTYLHAKT